MEPIEGGVYKDFGGNYFKVLAVGIKCGRDAFVIKVGGQLALFGAEAWEVVFKSPRKLRTEEVTTADTGIYYGHLCRVTKLPDSKIIFTNSLGETNWIIQYPDPQIKH